MPKKIVLTFFVLLLALMVGAFYSLPSFIDKENLKTQLSASFKAMTGLDLEIQGDAVIKRFPAPHVVINSMYVHNAQGATQPFLLTIRTVELWPSYPSIFRKRMSISRIVVDDIDLELERLKSNQMNWKDSSVQTSVPMGAAALTKDVNSSFIGTYVTVSNGYLRYTDSPTGTATEYKDISMAFLNGGAKSESTMKVNFRYNDKILNVSGKLGSLEHALSMGEVPANLNITSGKSNLVYEGNAGYRDNQFYINGSVKLSTDDIVSWISTFMGINDKPQLGGPEFKSLPLDAKSDITTENGKIIFPNLTLEGAIVKGGARIELSPPYGVNVKADMNTLDLETLFASKLFSLKEVLDPIKEAKTQAAKDVAFFVPQKPFFNVLNLSAEVKIEDTLYNQQHIKNIDTNFDMSNGEMTISQFTASLPGDTRVVFAGIGKESFQGFSIEGQVDANGADFTQAIKLMKSNGFAIPGEDFKRFRLKANAVISSKEIRLAELAARVEGMAFVGGFIATFGERIKLQAAMRVGGLNLDHFINIWGLEEWRTSFFDTTPGPKSESFLSRWLKKLDYDATMNVSLEQFTLNGAMRDKAEFRLDATTNKLIFNDLNTNYNGTNLTGSTVLDVSGSLPKLDLKLNADTFDVAQFFNVKASTVANANAAAEALVPQVQAARLPPNLPPEAAIGSVRPASARWSHNQFDFHWLEALNATFHFKFGHYQEGNLNAQQLDVLGMIENRTLTIEALTGIVVGAQVAAKGHVIGGKIPAILLAANITSLDTSQIIPMFPVLQGMTGKYNLSLRLETSGIDMFSWISSLQGSVGVGGRDVYIHGFNLPGVVRAVTYVRTVADILDVVKRAFPGGDTLFGDIDGQWTVVGGVMKTSNSKVVSDQADGLLTCQVDLVNWQTDSNISFTLRTLDPIHPPGMIVSFAGNLDRPEISLDTRSLEQYVTNKTSEKMLQQYGTH